MNRFAALLLLFCGLPCDAQNRSTEAGGRDVSVTLFSSQPSRSIIVTGASPHAWWATCATCLHQPFTASLRVPGLREIIAGGLVSVRDEEQSQVRTASGLWHIRSTDDGFVDVVLTVPSERYVAAVLMGEASSGDPREYLRAMAVVARTFVLKASQAEQTDTALSSHRLPSDTCDSTACQAARFGPVPEDISAAVRSTVGETLWFGPQRAQVFFSGSCGGTTESAGDIWTKLANLPYLRSIPDPYCTRKDRAPWHAEVPLRSVQEIAAQEGWRIPAPITKAQIAERTASHRVRTLVFFGSNQQARVSATALRLAVGREMGWNLIRSDDYNIGVHDGLLVFDGQGHGHGVGLCQQGAIEMSRLSRTYREILGFYFPSTNVRVARTDEGWKQVSQDGVNFFSTHPLSPAMRTAAVHAWRQASARFPARALAPSVTVAPSTELFRQMTMQPGWQMASTSGTSIVLQPETVLTSNHLPLEALLFHEMLHVQVEAVSSINTPLWLREGLVEVLADDAVSAPPGLSSQDTSRLLESAASQTQSQTAHRAAGARARQLIERYGMSRVRGWIETGASVPTN